MTAKDWLILCSSIISLILSLSIIIYLCYNGGCCSIDSINFGDTSITVITIVVGILIGWNIFYALDIKEQVKELHKELDKHKALNNREINNIIQTIGRADAYCKKLDDIIYNTIEILKNNGINPNKKQG